MKNAGIALRTMLNIMGNKFIFLASYIFRLSGGKEFKEDKDFGFNGRAVACRILKSRSSYNSITVPLVYHSKRGFHNEASSVNYLKETEKLKGGGRAGFFLEGHEEQKFTLREFIPKMRSNKIFRQIFDDYMSSNLECHIDNKSSDGEFFDDSTPEFEE